MTHLHTVLRRLPQPAPWIIAAAGLAALLAFSAVRYHWIRHETSLLSAPRIGPLLLASGVILTLGATGAMRSRDSAAAADWTRAARPLALGAPAALAQWKLGWSGPWLLYTWIALIAVTGGRLPAVARCTDVPARRALAVAALATLVMICFHAHEQRALWDALSFGYRDIGLFARALHNAAHGRGLWVDSLGRSILGEHACFALGVLVPFVRLGLDPMVLLMYGSAICLNGPALLVTWFAHRRWGAAAAMLAGLAWLLLPMHGCLAVAAGYGFHEVYLAVPLLVAGLAMTLQHRWAPATACMLAALAVREDIALTVAAWGLYVALVLRQRLLGAGVLAVSAIYLGLAVRWIVPHFRGSAYPHMTFHFRELFDAGALLSALPTNLSFLVALLLPFAMAPLVNWRLGLVAAPAILETLLTANRELHSLTFHYYTPAVPVLFFAAIQRLDDRSASPPVESPHAIRPHSDRRVLALLAAALAGQMYLGVGPPSNNPAVPTSPPQLRAVRGLIQDFTPAAPALSVTASYRLAAHFVGARALYEVHNEFLGDLVIVDDRDNWDASRPRDAIVRAMATGDYEPLFADYHTVILARPSARATLDASRSRSRAAGRRDERPAARTGPQGDRSEHIPQSPQPRLAEQLRPASMPDGVTATFRSLGHGIVLAGMRVEPVPPEAGPASAAAVTLSPGRHVASDQRCDVTLIWRCDTPPDRDYRFALMTADGSVRWSPFYFARGAYPASTWKPGTLYRDDVAIRIPTGVTAAPDKLHPVVVE